jgi:hypothetical protein
MKSPHESPFSIMHASTVAPRKHQGSATISPLKVPLLLATLLATLDLLLVRLDALVAIVLLMSFSEIRLLCLPLPKQGNHLRHCGRCSCSDSHMPVPATTSRGWFCSATACARSFERRYWSITTQIVAMVRRTTVPTYHFKLPFVPGLTSGMFIPKAA